MHVRLQRRLRFPPDPRASAHARRALRAGLQEAGLDDLVDVAVLLTSELCDNAVLHAGTAFGLELTVFGPDESEDEAPQVRITVTDQGPDPLELHLAMPRTGRAATHGRGLRLVQKLATEWGTHHHNSGHHSTWFTLRPEGSVEGASRKADVDAGGSSAWPEVQTMRWLLHVPAALSARLELPTLAAELLRRLCDVVEGESADIRIDYGDGRGSQSLAVQGPPMETPLEPASLVRVSLPLPSPLHGWLRLVLRSDSSSSVITARELAELTAQRIALAVELEAVRSDQRRRYSWMGYLAETSELLAQSLDVKLTVAMVPQLVVPRLGRWCAVHMIDETGALRLAALTHADEDAIPVLREELDGTGQRRRLLGNAAQRTAGPVSIRDPNDAVTVALTARGETLGALTVGRFVHRPHSPEEITLISDLARRASLAIDNAKITALHARTSQALQHALLPRELPVAAGVEFAAEYLPVSTGSEVGGDFYDVLAVDDNHWLVSIGDVCGKGARAAARTGLVREVLRVLINDGRSLPRAVELLNGVMLEAHDPQQFCTLAAVLVSRRGTDGEAGLSVELVLAGHEKPVLLRADGRTELIGEHGTAVGLVHEVSPTCTRHWLNPGDALVTYTDGVIERRRGAEQFGQQRLLDALAAAAGQPAPRLVGSVRDAVEAFSDDPPQDDIALLVVRALP